jgi:uncharacterized protein involved in response to NO
MGQSSAATVREIEDIRSRMDSNMRELERRMPQPGIWMKRMAGVVAGGGAAAIVTSAVLKRTRRRKREQRVANVDARVPQAVVQVVPAPVAERLAEAMEDGRWKRWAVLAGGVWLVVRLIELRQLRRVNRTLVGARA